MCNSVTLFVTLLSNDTMFANVRSKDLTIILQRHKAYVYSK